MRHIVLFLITCSFTLLHAQPKPGYYSGAEGKAERVLKSALYDIIKKHTDKGYAGLWTAYQTTDKRADGKVWDMYSNCNFTFGTHQDKGSGGTSECQYYNREHSIPQSWFDKESPMVSDAFHIYPTDKLVNNKRGNSPFGEVGNASWTSINGSKLGNAASTSGYSGEVFEPIDEYKGDFARTYFYFATRYENIMTTIGGESFSGNVYPALSSWSLNLFLKWHRNDPVSKKETDRNNAVEAYQKNRNPFIDYPELVEYIWGDKKGVSWSVSSGLSEQFIEFSISANFVNNELQILTKETDIRYIIYNINGQLLLEGSLNDGNMISTQNLQNGLYLIKLHNNSKSGVQKFVISK